MKKRMLGSLFMAMLFAGCTTFLHDNRINVRDMGAKGDGVTDDRPVFEKAIAMARESEKPVTIYVPSGEYRLVLPEDSDAFAHLDLSKLKNVTVQGKGHPVLICASPYHHGIGINNSSNITIRGLAVDYDPLPFTQGIIVATNPEKQLIDFKVENGYPLPTASHIDFTVGKCKNVGYVFDPQTGRKLNQFYDQYLREQVKDMGNGVYRYKSSNPTPSEMVGKRFAVVGRRKADGVKINAGYDCFVEDVHVYTAPACGYNVATSSGITIDNCKIIQRPGTTRVMSTVADGLHTKWCYSGTTLSNSSFTGMGDDSVNVGGSYTPVLEQLDNHSVIVKAHGSINAKNKQLVVTDLITHGHIDLGPVKSVKGTRVEGYKGPCQKITFENAIPNMTTWRETGDTKKNCSKILNLAACGRGARIINNHFYNHRCRGVLMRGPDSVIKGNHFDTLAGPGVIVANDGGFLSEGPSGDGTIVENNRFTNIERSCIMVYSSIGEQSKEATNGVVNVKILNNTFDDFGGQNIYGRGKVGNVLFIKNANNLLIRGNKIGTLVSDSPECPPVLVQNNGNVVFEENTIDGRSLTDADIITIKVEEK